MPPTPAMSNNRPLPNSNKVHPTAIDSLSLSPSRHRNNQLLPPCTVAIGPFPGLSAACAKVLTPAKRTQIAARRIANKHNIPAMPPIATIRTPSGDMSLPAEAHATVAASPTFNPDFRFVVHGNGEGKCRPFALCRP